MVWSLRESVFVFIENEEDTLFLFCHLNFILLQILIKVSVNQRFISEREVELNLDDTPIIRLNKDWNGNVGGGHTVALRICVGG